MLRRLREDITERIGAVHTAFLTLIDTVDEDPPSTPDPVVEGDRAFSGPSNSAGCPDHAGRCSPRDRRRDGRTGRARPTQPSGGADLVRRTGCRADCTEPQPRLDKLASMTRVKTVLEVRRLARIPSLAKTVLAAAVLLLAPAVVGPAFAPTAHAQGCPDIEVVFARGTNDTPGLGRVGQAFVDSLRGQVGGRSVGAYAVNYPATFDFLAAAGGANDASAHIQYMMANCPGTRLVLGGYSQGAAVIDIIAAVPFPAVGFNNPLPANAPDFVAAIALFGNPTTKVELPITVSPVWGSRSIDLCAVNDPVCSLSGEDIGAHSNYVSSGMTNQAAAFVARLL